MIHATIGPVVTITDNEDNSVLCTISRDEAIELFHQLGELLQRSHERIPSPSR